MRSIIGIILFLGLGIQLWGQVPAPEEGQRWVLNNPFSDEFNGTELDLSKWHDRHPYWVGRSPAIFMPDALTIQNGELQIKNYKLDKDSIYTSPWNGSQTTYTMAGGAVVSKSDKAHYGYYEVRMKASRIRMSTTFWLKNRWVGGSAEAECPNNITELDIIEAIGDWNVFDKNMKSNTHYIHKECGQEEVWHSKGGSAAVGGHVSDAFHVYAAHWKNPKEIDFYIDGVKKHTIRPNTAENSEPFSRPMFMNMVTETYDWVTPPTTADLNDDKRNTSYYDWVRSYYLIDVDEPLAAESIITNGGFETGDFDGWIGWGGSPREVISDDVHSGIYAVRIVGAGAPEQKLALKPNSTYTLSCFAKAKSGTIGFGVKEDDSEGKFLGGTDVMDAEYTEYKFDFTTEDEGNVKLYFFAQAGEEGYADDFKIVETNGAGATELVMPFDPSLDYYDTPTYDAAAKTVSSKIEYKASVDRDIVIELKDNSNAVVSSLTASAFAGFGRKIYELELTDPVNDGETYTLSTKLIAKEDPNTILAETSTQIMDFTSSNNELSIEPALKLFPNPVDQVLNIENGDRKPYVIFDLLGRAVRKGLIPMKGTLDLQDLQQGTYIFTTENFRKVFFKK